MPTLAVPPETDVEWVERVHGAVDRLVAPLAATQGARLRCCAGCHGCCADGLAVFAIEADLIELRHADLLANGAPSGGGGCAFLDGEGQCRIYESRPYVCRTQGLPLRWLGRDEHEGAVELRDICVLNVEGGPPLEALPADQCWTLGPVEARLAARQIGADADGGFGRRVTLRGLFASSRRHLLLAP
jgi:uncharacterized protein